MLYNIFLYLGEASMGLAAFSLAYHLLFRKLTHFQWNRGYLLGSLLLSMLIPLLPLPWLLPDQMWTTTPMADTFWLNLQSLDMGKAPQASATQHDGSINSRLLPYSTLGLLLLGIYLAGCFYKGCRLFQNLRAVYLLIADNQQTRKAGYVLIHTHEHLSPFSFLHYIFLHCNSSTLEEAELKQVLQHEQIHIAQRHTVDILLFEVAGVFFWFHPAIYYLKSRIREVHEYQVDALMTSTSGQVRKYGELLLKLAMEQSASPILNTFSSRQIFQRITMLTQPKSNPMQKFKFLCALPVMALTLFICSFSQSGNQTAPPVKSNRTAAAEVSNSTTTVYIRKITWKGNKAYTAAELTKALGLQAGDPYNEEELNQRLNYNPAGSDVSSLYMDNGYLYFSVQPKLSYDGQLVDLEMNVEEGPQANIGQVRVSGNTKIASAEILEKINIKEGELFSRAKVIAANNALVAMGYFNPEKIGINPLPNTAAGTVDIEFTVEEK